MSQSDVIPPGATDSQNGQLRTGNGLDAHTQGFRADTHAVGVHQSIPMLTYFSMIWRRKVLIILTMLAMGAPAFFVSTLQPPSYKASADLLLNQDVFDVNYNVVSKDFSEPALNDQISILTGPAISQEAAKLGATSEATAIPKSNSNEITIMASSSDRDKAIATVNAYIQAYVQYGQSRNQSALSDASVHLQARIDQFQQAVNNALPEDRGILQQQQLRFMDQVTRLEIQRGLASKSATIVRDAEAPTSPSSPTPLRDGAFGLIIGLILGVSVAVLLETVRSRREAHTT